MSNQIIGNTEYKSIKNKAYINGSPDNLFALSKELDRLNISYSGRISNYRSAVTVEQSDYERASAIMADIVNKAPARRFIGNTPYKYIQDKKVLSGSTDIMEAVAQRLNEEHILHSGVIDGNNTKITVSGEVNADIVRKYIAEEQARTQSITAVYMLKQSSNTIEDTYYISAVNDATGEELYPYRNTFKDIPVFFTVDEAVKYAAGAEITLANSNSQLNKWRISDNEREQTALLEQHIKLIEQLPKNEEDYAEHFVFRDNAVDWVYFNPDGNDGKGQFIGMSIYEADILAAYRERAASDDIESGRFAFLEMLTRSCEEKFIDAGTAAFESCYNDFMAERQHSNVIETYGIYPNSRFTANVDMLIEQLEDRFDTVKTEKEKSAVRTDNTILTAESDEIIIEGYSGTWYVIDTHTADGTTLFLLESEIYGDETSCLIVDENRNLIMDNVHNGFADYLEKNLVPENQMIIPAETAQEMWYYGFDVYVNNNKLPEHEKTSDKSSIFGSMEEKDNIVSAVVDDVTLYHTADTIAGAVWDISKNHYYRDDYKSDDLYYLNLEKHYEDHEWDTWNTAYNEYINTMYALLDRNYAPIVDYLNNVISDSNSDERQSAINAHQSLELFRYRLDEIRPIEEKNLDELLYDKVNAEYNLFISNLKKEPADVLIQSAAEIVDKDKIRLYLEENTPELSDEQYKALLSREYPLDEIYEQWIKNSELHSLDDVAIAVEETADRILISLGREQPAAPIIEEDEPSELDKAIAYINNYVSKEFDIEESVVSDENLEHVSLGYTELGDNAAYPFQVEADLKNFAINYYISENLMRTDKYDSLDELIEKELENLEFDYFVSEGNSLLEKMLEKEAENSAIEQAKEYIRDYVGATYGENEYFTDVKNISLDHCAVGRVNEYVFNIVADLEAFAVRYMIDGNTVQTEQYSSIEEMNNKTLSQLDYTANMALANRLYEEYERKQYEKQSKNVEAEVMPLYSKSLETENEQAQRSYADFSVTQADIDILRTLPPRKSVLNFTDEEKNVTAKWAERFESDIAEKSPFYRAAHGDWRADEDTRVPVIDIPNIYPTFTAVRNDIKNGVIPRDSIVNSDTTWNIQISRKGLEDSIHYANKHNDVATLNTIYHIQELLKDAILLDSTIIGENQSNKAYNTAYMHKLYDVCRIDNEPYLAKFAIEEFLNGKDDTLKRMYNVQDIKIEPLRHVEFTENQLAQSVLNGTDISISDLFSVVKACDKDFYTNSPDYQLMHENDIKTAVPFYTKDYNEAKASDEMDLYFANINENRACRDAIDAAIGNNYDNNRLNSKAALDSVLQNYTLDRVAHVIAVRMCRSDKDIRISRENRQWAAEQTADMSDIAQKAARDYQLTSHPGLIDIFADSVRDELAQQKEKAATEKENTYEIYQIPRGEQYHDLRFLDYEKLEIMGQKPDPKKYEKVYSGYLDDIQAENKLEQLFYIFNMERPDDFAGHSLSVSDIVVINDENGSHAYYVDSVGYKDITDMFLNRTEIKQYPTITCEWSESTVFEDGKTYSVYEFDNLMKQADTERHEGWKSGLEKYGNSKKWLAADEESYYTYIGYEKTKFTINFPDGRKITERQDIGDGEGGVIDFLNQYPQYRNAAAELKEAYEAEKNNSPLGNKEPVETENEQAQRSYADFSVTQADIDILRTLPPRKSVLNFTDEEKSVTAKWAERFESDIAEKSPFYRAAHGDWRADEKAVVPIITVSNHDATSTNVKADIKSHKIYRGNTANYDTHWDIQVSRKGIEDTYMYAIKHNDKVSLNALYHIDTIIENSVLLDTTVSEYNNKNKSPDTLLMHKMYSIINFDNEKYVAKLTIEEFANAHNGTQKRLYNLQDIKIEPLRHLSLTAEQLHLSVLNGTDISISDLFSVVKACDKDFYTNSPDYHQIHENSTELTSEKKKSTDNVEIGDINKQTEVSASKNISMRTVTNEYNSVLIVNEVRTALDDLYNGSAADGQASGGYDWKNFHDALKKVMDANIHSDIAFPLYKSDADKILMAAYNENADMISDEQFENALKNLDLVLQNGYMLENPEEQPEQISFFGKPSTHVSMDEVSPFDLSDKQKTETEVSHTNPDKSEEKHNYTITSDDYGNMGGAKARYAGNIAAIRLLKTIETEQRKATPQEQEILAKYVGWGGIPQAFDPKKKDWTKEYNELKELLTPSEYSAARASTLNAHYTSPIIINAIYDGLKNLGFESGKIIEPAMGIGNFFGSMPETMRNNSELYGVELDSITGRIAQQLYQSADIQVKGFEKTSFENNTFDIAIGNVPFGSEKLFDKDYKKENFHIHDYFFAKTLDKVRPGGIVAFVTSKGTLDKDNPDVRKYLAERAELLGAIRLPNNAFKSNAGTEVTSDIIFLQKREKPISIEDNTPDWVYKDMLANGISVNKYFADHPEMILGEMMQGEEFSLYGNADATACVPIEGANLKEQLAEAVKNITGEYTAAEKENSPVGNFNEINCPPDAPKYSYIVENDKLYYHTTGDKMTAAEGSADNIARITAMVKLRDSMHELFDLQLNNRNGILENDITQKQHELNAQYDSFAAKYGRIAEPANKKLFDADNSYHLIKNLEKYDDKGNYLGKADIFTKKTINPQIIIDHCDNANDALILSLSEKMCVNLEYMSMLTGKTEDMLIKELEGKIYQNPQRNMRWESADEYLTGNIRQKLIAAEAAGMERNIEALKAVMPERIEAADISVKLGSAWVDPEYIRQFIIETIKPDFWTSKRIEVIYSAATDKWKVDGWQKCYDNILATETYGTHDMNAYEIIEATLNMKKAEVRERVRDEHGNYIRDEKGKYVLAVNPEKTMVVQEKQDELKRKYQDWIFADPERREKLVTIYNEKFNSTRLREYDGSQLHFVGMNAAVTLKEHQKNAVARSLYSNVNTLLAHEVGAGKTFEMIAIAMEGKRLGLHNKSLITAPNALTEQWGEAFRTLYPNANVLVTRESDFTKENRRNLFAKIATGDWDAVIIGHSQFDMIHLSKDKELEMMYAEQEILEQALTSAEQESNGKSNFSVKQIERSLKSYQERIEKLLARTPEEDMLCFEKLGVDKIFIDESQAYKNLDTPTKMTNVSGIGSSGSGRAMQLLMKCKYLDELTGGKGVVFASGTPISNSMSEMYTLMRYLQADKLKELGINSFDRWASIFGETTTSMELSPEANGKYQMKTRFAKFQNLPELMNIFKECADIRTAASLNLDRPDAEIHNINVPATKKQTAMIKNLGKRAKRIRDGKIDPREDNMLKITSDGRKIGLDQRCINPSLPDDPNSKVNVCVKNVFDIWQRTSNEKSTQLIFCDLATPQPKPNENVYMVLRKNAEGTYKPVFTAKLGAKDTAEKILKRLNGKKPPKNFNAGGIFDGDIIATRNVNYENSMAYHTAVTISNGKTADIDADMWDNLPFSKAEPFASERRYCVYDDIKDKLMSMGVPEKEIAFIHDADKTEDKQKIFDKMNNGEIRVLIGSTQKCGAGMNARVTRLQLKRLHTEM